MLICLYFPAMAEKRASMLSPSGPTPTYLGTWATRLSLTSSPGRKSDSRKGELGCILIRLSLQIQAERDLCGPQLTDGCDGAEMSLKRRSLGWASPGVIYACYFMNTISCC